MNQHYDDIRSRIPEEPQWFDEHMVPRYCAFGPRQVANIYAEEVALCLIACQACGHEFKVAASWSITDEIFHKQARFSSRPVDEVIGFADPPNIRC